MSVAVKPARQDGLLTVEFDVHNEGLRCVQEGILAHDPNIDRRSSGLQIPTVNKEALPVSKPSPSPASCRTPSTELYVPPYRKGDSSLDVSSVKIDQQNAGPRTPIQTMVRTQDSTNCHSRLERNKRYFKRKRNQALATADVEAALGDVVSAGEAVVLGNLMDGSSLPAGQDGSRCLEAALSLRNARKLSGLDHYDLNAAIKDSDDSAMQDLDPNSMQEAYADVGIIIDEAEDERQVLGVGNLQKGNVEIDAGALCGRSCHSERDEPLQSNGGAIQEACKYMAQSDVDAEALCARSCPSEKNGPMQRSGEAIQEVCTYVAQNCGSFRDFFSHSLEVQTGLVVGQQNEFECCPENTQIIQQSERGGDNAETHSFGIRQVKETVETCELARGASNGPLKENGLIQEMSVKEPSPSCQFGAGISPGLDVKIGAIDMGCNEINGGDNHQEIGVKQAIGSDILGTKAVSVSLIEGKHCQRHSTPSIAVLATMTQVLEDSQLDGETATRCIVPKQINKPEKGVSCPPEDKATEIVAQEPKANLVIQDIPSDSDMIYGDILLQLSSSSEGIEDKAKYQEEVKTVNSTAMEVNGTSNEATGSLESTKLQAMASPEMKLNSLDASIWNATTILNNPSIRNATRNRATSYVSRWCGGWPGNVEPSPVVSALPAEKNLLIKRLASTSLSDIGSEDAVPERIALLARQKNTLLGRGVGTYHRVSANDHEGPCPPENDERASEQCENGPSNLNPSCSQVLPMSQIDPLCSFVPCSISGPAAVSATPCHRDVRSSNIVASVEACARAAIDTIDNLKLVDGQQRGQAFEVASVPDPAVRNDIETLGQQIYETGRDAVSPPIIKDGIVKRRLSSMRNFSTKHTFLSMLLHAVDTGEKCLSKYCILDGDGLEQHGIQSPSRILRGSLSAFDCPERLQVEAERSLDCDMQVTMVTQDVTMTARGKGVKKTKCMASPGLQMSADFSESPPMVWPRGKKRRLSVCRVIDSDSIEWPHDHNATVTAFADDHLMAQKDSAEEGCKVQPPSQKSGRRTSTRGKPCHDPRTLFKGLQFLITGLGSQKKQKLSKSIESHGGEVLANVPSFSPKQRFKRRGIDCGARNPPFVIAPQQMRTHKYLYGCAVGSPLLTATWISASISAVRCLSHNMYEHKQAKAGCPLKDSLGVAKTSNSPLFVGFQFIFHGQQDFISRLSTLAQHAGGTVIHKLVLEASKRKQVQKQTGLVVLEESSSLPLELQQAASQLEFHIVDGEWMVVSLLNRKLMPYPAKSSTPPSSVFPSQQSSARTKEPLQREPLQRYKRRRRLLQSENLESKRDGNSGIELLVKKLKDSSLPGKNGVSCPSVKAKSGGKELVDQGNVDTCWLGKGFTTPPAAPKLADRLLGPYSHLLTHQKLTKKFLYYDSFLCNGVEYFLGDIVEVPRVSGPPSVARIEGLWCEDVGKRLPETQAFQQGVRKKASKNVVLKCRRFYLPSDTGFPGQQGNKSTNELYLSNDSDINVLGSDIVRRVRVKLETAGEVVHCKHWYNNDGHDDDDDDDRVRAALPMCNKKVTIAANDAQYFCSFFYDHVGESLHRIKLDM